MSTAFICPTSAADFCRPPAGWNAWFAFDRAVTEKGVLANAHALVRTGLAEKGYRYVNVDDAWAGPREPDGTPTSDNVTFTSGIPVLASAVHALNLSFGEISVYPSVESNISSQASTLIGDLSRAVEGPPA